MNAQKCEFQREEDKSRRLVTVLMPPTHEVNWAIFTYSVLRFFLDEWLIEKWSGDEWSEDEGQRIFVVVLVYVISIISSWNRN
jgi:hypothetical protein